MDIDGIDEFEFPTPLHQHYALARALYKGANYNSYVRGASNMDGSESPRRPGLPKEIVIIILRAAELLHPTTSRRLSFSWCSEPRPPPVGRRYRDREALGLWEADDKACVAVTATDSNVASKLVLATCPLSRTAIHKMANFMLMTESRDQGRLMLETGSWSWFEVGIIRGERGAVLEQPENSPTISLSPASSGPESQEEQHRKCKIEPKSGLPLRWVSHNNAIAGRRFTARLGQEFGPGHPIFQYLEPGDRLGIWVCARHEGWACKVRGLSFVAWEWWEPTWF